MGNDGRLRLGYLHGGVVSYRPGETLGPRVLADYELVLIIEGNVTYQVASQSYAAPPGSVILARPGFREMYRWDPKGPTRHAFFHFAIDRPAEDWPEPADWPIVRTQPEQVLPALFRHVLERIGRHTDWPACSPGRSDAAIVEALVTIFLEEPLAETASMGGNRPVAVSRVINFMRCVIDEDPRQPLDLARLASVAGLSEKHLCRLFQRTLGYSPMHTFRLLCLQLSLALLARSNLSIKQIAHRCGFDDPGYFSRCFAAVFGRAPREVRRRLAEGHLPPPNPLPADISPRVLY